MLDKSYQTSNPYFREACKANTYPQREQNLVGVEEKTEFLHPIILTDIKKIAGIPTQSSMFIIVPQMVYVDEYSYYESGYSWGYRFRDAENYCTNAQRNCNMVNWFNFPSPPLMTFSQEAIGDGVILFPTQRRTCSLFWLFRSLRSLVIALFESPNHPTIQSPSPFCCFTAIKAYTTAPSCLLLPAPCPLPCVTNCQ